MRTFWYVNGKLEKCSVVGEFVRRAELVLCSLDDLGWKANAAATMPIRVERRRDVSDALGGTAWLFLPEGRRVELRHGHDVFSWMQRQIDECATRIGASRFPFASPRWRMFELVRRYMVSAPIEAERMALAIERTMRAKSHEILDIHAEERRLLDDRFHSGKLSREVSRDLYEGWVHQLQKLGDLTGGDEAGPAFSLAMRMKHGA